MVQVEVAGSSTRTGAARGCLLLRMVGMVVRAPLSIGRGRLFGLQAFRQLEIGSRLSVLVASAGSQGHSQLVAEREARQKK